MEINDILLIIISGLGVVHGLFLGIFLWSYEEGKKQSNRILSLLLLILSFRVGKSVLLEFTENLDIKIIFGGLATLMAIAPLFWLYVRSVISRDFKIKISHAIHFVPTTLGIGFGLWLDNSKIEGLPMIFFAFLFLTYYLQYLAYLIAGFRLIWNSDGQELSKWLKLLFFGLLAIWFVYVLNLFDEFVPYVLGPILYTIVAYLITYIAFKKGYLRSIQTEKYKTTPISDEQIGLLFEKASKLIIEEKGYQNTELTLKSLSEDLKVSTQILSLVINKKADMNFNSFINHHRVEDAKTKFQDSEYDNRTIASIAFEVGFNSITSFNSAFKKETGKTPQSFRSELTK